jgi:glycosyltransferase involved in cell wall biosynthesis
VTDAEAAAATRRPQQWLIDAHHVGHRQTGNETWVRNISRELAKSGHADRLAWATTTAGAPALKALTGRDPHHLSTSAVRRLALDLPRIARRVDAGAILVQYTMPLTRRPCVVVVHDLSPYDAAAGSWLPGPTAARIRRSIKHSARKAALLLAPSAFTRHQLLERFPRDPDDVSVCANAVDPELAAALGQAQRTRDDDAFVVLAVGNVVPRKNLTVAAEAVSRLRTSGLDARLRVVGTVAPNGRAAGSAIEDALGAAVSFSGYVTTPALAQEYADADALAFPSLFEGFGIPALEAMAAGLPVVVSDRAALPEVVGDAGIVAAADDVDAWVSALSRVAGDAGVRSALVAAGHRRAAGLTWSDSADVVARAFQRIS